MRTLRLAVFVLSVGVSGLFARAEEPPFDGAITWSGNGLNGVTVQSVRAVTSPVYSGQYIEAKASVSGEVSGPVTVFLYYQRLCYYSAGGHQATHDAMIGYTTLPSLSGTEEVTVTGVAPFQAGWDWSASGEVLYIIKTKSPSGYSYGDHWFVNQQPPTCGATGGAAGSTGPQANPMSYGPGDLTTSYTLGDNCARKNSCTNPVASGQFVEVEATISGTASGKVMVGLYYQRLTDHGPGHQATQDVLIGYQILPSLSGSATVSLKGASPFEVGWDELPSGDVLFMIKLSTADRYAGLTASPPDGDVIQPIYGCNWWVTQTLPTGGTTGDGSSSGGTTLPVNCQPLAIAGPDQIVEDADGSGSEMVTIDGSNSMDVDGTIDSYVWKEGTVELSNDATLHVDLSVGRHYIKLYVTDDDGAVRSDTVIIDVVDNFPPVADAGVDLTARDDDMDDQARVSLDGSGSYDKSAVGSIVSYVWTEQAEQIAIGSTPQVDLPVGIHTITLTVTDNKGAQATDSLLVIVEFQDDDGDGMADTWEVENFSDLSYTATGDPDEDGAPNVAEFATGTDPNDPLSFPVGLSGSGCVAGDASTRSSFVTIVLLALTLCATIRNAGSRPA
jgi:hypothetical protein